MFYLSKEDWSPRFEPTFFTVSLDARMTCSNSPPSITASSQSLPSRPTQKYSFIGGNNSFPAIYFNLRVQCAHQEHSCPRRYSQFRRLYDDLRFHAKSVQQLSHESQAQKKGNRDQNTNRDDDCRDLYIPPKTCPFQPMDEEFLDVRQKELYEFIDDLLKRPVYVNHPSVHAFLELDHFVSVNSD